MQRDGRRFTVEVTADGEGLVSHAGSALLAQVADKTGLSEGALGRPARAQAAPIGPRRRPRRARPLRDALQTAATAFCDAARGARAGAAVRCGGLGLDGVSGDDAIASEGSEP